VETAPSSPVKVAMVARNATMLANFPLAAMVSSMRVNVVTTVT
jgi:hypothetical protein|tara:strand:- start:1033 stop:1161 length:129 start_codon:yes stop_codon:yes gene_type:complete